MRIIFSNKEFRIMRQARPGELIAPMVLSGAGDRAQVLYMRIYGDFSPERQRQVASVLNKYDPDFIFRHFLLTNTFLSKFDNEQRMVKMVSAGTFLAIVINFIGLMALSVMNVSRRTKEIGIRKVAGSSVAGVMTALLAVSWQSWKAATRNPVEALRYE